MKLWTESELFQWEKDRYVYVSLNASDPKITYIQFYNDLSELGPEVPLESNKAKIPDYLLRESLPIMAVACTGSKGKTRVIGRREFQVIRRAKPEIIEETVERVIYDGGEEV